MLLQWIRKILHRHKREIRKGFTKEDREYLQGFIAMVHPMVYAQMQGNDIRVCEKCGQWESVETGR